MTDTTLKETAAAYLAWVQSPSEATAVVFLAAVNELSASEWRPDLLLGVLREVGLHSGRVTERRRSAAPGGVVTEAIRRAERVVTTVGGRSDG